MASNHSAEWLRGAVWALEDLPEMDESVRLGWIHRRIEIYASELSAAEAREAGSVKGKKNADYWRGAVELLRRYKGEQIELTHLINECLDQYALAKTRESGTPTAEEVIAACKRALENVTQAAETAGFTRNQGQLNPPCHVALDAIAAWEAARR